MLVYRAFSIYLFSHTLQIHTHGVFVTQILLGATIKAQLKKSNVHYEVQQM